MASEPQSGKKPAGWAEHTVVANFPRVLPRAVIGSDAAPEHPALREAAEPLTVIGEPPSHATARALLARYAALNDTAPGGVTTEVESKPQAPAEEPLRLPLRTPLWRRVVEFWRDDFERAPRIVRLLVPALPLVAIATTFLDRDPTQAAAARSSVASGAMPSASASQPALATAPKSTLSPIPLPVASVALGKNGRTLPAEAADAAARRDRPRAIALYAELAREHPDEPAYASAARILMRDEARDRPRDP